MDTAYKELCASYRAIDDFRQKLLALLPLASASGIYFIAGGSANPMPPAIQLSSGIFGFMVSLGLMIFEIHGIRKCTHLIVVGEFFEKELNITGQFLNRPNGLQPVNDQGKSLARLINEPLASGVIYPSVMAGWLFLALSVCLAKYWALLISLAVFVIGFWALLKFNIWLVDTDCQEKASQLASRK